MEVTVMYRYNYDKREFRKLRKLLIGRLWLFTKLTVLLPLDDKFGERHEKLRKMATACCAEYSSFSNEISYVLKGYC